MGSESGSGVEPGVDRVGVDLVEVDDIVLDLEAHRAWIEGQEIDVELKEFAALARLAADAGEVVSMDELGRAMDAPSVGNVRSKNHSLRKKVGRGRIETAHGVGYRLRRTASELSVAGVARQRRQFSWRLLHSRRELLRAQAVGGHDAAHVLGRLAAANEGLGVHEVDPPLLCQYEGEGPALFFAPIGWDRSLGRGRPNVLLAAGEYERSLRVALELRERLARGDGMRTPKPDDLPLASPVVLWGEERYGQWEEPDRATVAELAAEWQRGELEVSEQVETSGLHLVSLPCEGLIVFAKTHRAAAQCLRLAELIRPHRGGGRM